MFQKRKIFFRNLNHSVFTLLNDSQIPVFNSQYNHMFIMNESAFKRSAGLSILQTSWIIKVGIAIQNCSCYGIMPIMMSSYTISEKFVKYQLDGQKWEF